MVRKIPVTIPDETLQKDLEKYRNMAMNLGASDAKIIRTDIVNVDERSRVKCSVPKCPWYGTNANCPPHLPDISFWRETIRKYRYGVAFRLEVLFNQLVGDVKATSNPRSKILEIASKIEAEAFYDAYYYALAFGSGPCKPALCPNEKCAALTLGASCKQPLKSRPSMEAVGIDTFSLATNLGWDMYPIGKKTPRPHPVCGSRIGLILIA